MRLKALFRAALAALTFTLVTSVAAMAKNGHDLVLLQNATVTGTHLASGRYRVQWETHSPEATVTFQQGKTVIATAQGKLVDRGTKYPANAILTTQGPDGSQIIQELRFAGSSQVIVFNN